MFVNGSLPSDHYISVLSSVKLRIVVYPPFVMTVFRGSVDRQILSSVVLPLCCTGEGSLESVSPSSESVFQSSIEKTRNLYRPRPSIDPCVFLSDLSVLGSHQCVE